MSAENPNELRVGDPPIPVQGSYDIHLHSPSGSATVQKTHWRDEPDTWDGIINLTGVTGNAGVVMEMAGFVRLIGDTNAKVSFAFLRSAGYRS
jgi:hypothetical protein